jgi:hypothetical protein
VVCNTHAPKAAAYFTTSTGVKASPAFPPIVPLIPEIDFINATQFYILSGAKVMISILISEEKFKRIFQLFLSLAFII